MSPVMLIAAGSGGVGAALARLAGQRGFDVAIGFASNEDAAAAVARDVRQHGRRAVTIQADLTEEADICRMFEEFDGSFGHLDAFVHTADGTGGPPSDLADVATTTLRRAMDLNLLGAHFSAALAVRRMSVRLGGRGGSIVFTSSRAAEYGEPNRAVWYAAVKQGVNVLTKALGGEVAEDGIRVNAVSLGPIDADESDPPATGAEPLDGIPLHRYGRPAEVAEAVLFLTSPAAAFITGTVLNVAGGR